LLVISIVACYHVTEDLNPLNNLIFNAYGSLYSI